MKKLPEKINLLEDFDNLNYEEWKKFVEEELKGIPFEKKLITKTYEGIDLKPLYDKDDLKNIQFLNSKPGFSDYVRGTEATGYLLNGWNIHQLIPDTLPEDFNKTLLHNLENGQNCIYIFPDWYTLNNQTPPSHYTKEHYQNGLSIFHYKDFECALTNVDLYKYPIYFKAGFNGLPIFYIFLTFLNQRKIQFEKISGGIYIDPYEHLLVFGSILDSLENTFDNIALLTKWVSVKTKNFKTINVSGLPYHNAGATAIQELAYCFATAIEYINNLLERELDINSIANSFSFTFGVGSFYFMEIAKLRAARLLWSKIIELYGGNEQSRKIHITSVTSSYNKTEIDPYVNILRTTTEAFSAVLGGADCIQTTPFDEYCRLPDEFSQRIARNIQIILNYETNLYRLIDPSGGSYYVESLTNKIAENTFNLLKQIISNGGMLNLLKQGIPQTEVEDIHQSRVNDFVKRKSVLIGVNKYANINEKRLEERQQNLEEIYKTRFNELQKIKVLNKESEIYSTFKKENIFNEINNNSLLNFTIQEIFNLLKDNSKKELKIKTIKQHRLAEIFEVLRKITEELKSKFGAVPSVFLATMGSIKEYKIRADFAREFFEVAGFNVIIKKGYEAAEDIVKDAIESKAKIIVICSTDELYIKYVPLITSEIKKNKINIITVLAGYPENQIEEYKKCGIDEFIFLGVNAFDTLNKILKKII